MDQRDPVEKQNIPQEMAREDGWTRRKARVCYHLPCIQLEMMNVGGPTWGEFRINFSNPLGDCPLLLPRSA